MAWARLLAGSQLLLFFACQSRPSACWYFCWYRQQSATKIISNSISYGIRRLPARGTNFLLIDVQTLRDATEARVDFIMQAMRPSIDGALQREHRIGGTT